MRDILRTTISCLGGQARSIAHARLRSGRRRHRLEAVSPGAIRPVGRPGAAASDASEPSHTHIHTHTDTEARHPPRLPHLLRRCWPTLTRDKPTFGRTGPNVGRFGPRSRRFGLQFVRTEPTCRRTEHTCRIDRHWARVRPKVGPSRRRVGPFPKSGPARPKLGQLSPTSGLVQPGPTQLGVRGGVAEALVVGQHRRSPPYSTLTPGIAVTFATIPCANPS